MIILINWDSIQVDPNLFIVTKSNKIKKAESIVRRRRRRRSTIVVVVVVVQVAVDPARHHSKLTAIMRITRLLEETSAETHATLNQEQFVALVAKHKALLLQCDEGSGPLSVDDFAKFMEGLQLQHYEYVGGAGEIIRVCLRTRINIVINFH